MTRIEAVKKNFCRPVFVRIFIGTIIPIKENAKTGAYIIQCSEIENPKEINDKGITINIEV